MKRRLYILAAILLFVIGAESCYHPGYYHHPRHRHTYYWHRNPRGGWYQNYGFSR